MLKTLKITRRIKFLSYNLLIRFSSSKQLDLQKWKIKKMMDVMPPSRDQPIIMKLDTPEFHSIFTPELKRLSNIFQKHNHEIRIAGGAVRDMLMGIKPTDLDFATTATPEEMKSMFTAEEIRMINDRGEKHGTITARINDKENFEVTTLRIDVATDGRHAEVVFTKDWQLDANRRDLTINSMFLDLEGNVYDYFYGYDDLLKKRVVFVGDANIRIREDFLRIFRYFRFYGRIAERPDGHDENTIKAIRQNVDGLERISGERIWSEWSKILEGRFGGELTIKMLDCGIAPYVGLPKNQNTEEFIKAYEKARENGVTLRPMTLLTTLLKNQTEMMDLHIRLKLSVFNRDLALFLIEHREAKLCEKPLKPYQEIVITSTSKTANVVEYVRELLKLQAAYKTLEDFNAWEIPRFPVNGHHLKRLIPHPKITGRVLMKLKTIWLDDDFKPSAEELLKRVPEIVAEIEEQRNKSV